MRAKRLARAGPRRCPGRDQAAMPCAIAVGVELHATRLTHRTRTRTMTAHRSQGVPDRCAGRSIGRCFLLEFLESDTDTDSGWLTSQVRRCMHGPAALPPVDKKAAGLCGWKWVRRREWTVCNRAGTPRSVAVVHVVSSPQSACGLVGVRTCMPLKAKWWCLDDDDDMEGMQRLLTVADRESFLWVDTQYRNSAP
jgi:hypothetical protein